jgi:hypothetical protein
MKTNFLLKTIFQILTIVLFTTVNAQKITKTIKGTVIDKESKMTLPGASVYLSDLTPIVGTVSNPDGTFRIEGVETGRHSLCVSYIGYKPVCIENLNLTSGKEIVLTIEIEEEVKSIDEVVVKARASKSDPLNTMSTVSSRTFSVEETERYAGARNDVARMALNFAGVAAGNDATNEIIIRGNSPNGLLWRLEGVEIPNPNHFGSMGMTGGPVGMLNNNTLSNSDFMTGAFAAEYGNAFSGVFDLKMRDGNYDKHEFLGQIGFNGFELGAEGPISKKNNSSYMFNYRYSTLGVFHLLGISFGTGTAIPEYQDLSFKVTSGFAGGKLSLFGLAGISSIDLLWTKEDSADAENFYANEGLNIYAKNKQGVAGLKYFRLISNSTYAELTLSADGIKNADIIDTIYNYNGATRLFERTSLVNTNYAANLVVNTKFNNRFNTRIGGEFRYIDFSLNDSVYLSKYNAFFTYYDDQGSTLLLRGFIQGSYKLSDKLTANAGLHVQALTLNNEVNYEPRVGLKYRPAQRHTLSIGYGMHSKMLPMFFYYRRVDISQTEYSQPNKKLESIKAHHYVASWDWQITQVTRVKVDAYYQQLYNAVVEVNPSSFSLINSSSFQYELPDSLKNGGTGTNMGFEVTFEQFMHKGLYYLATISVFDSKYKGSDGIERSTVFDGGYVLNALGGKEFQLNSKKGKNKKFITSDIKLTAAGGQRYTPIDIAESARKQETVYQKDKAYSERFNDYFRLDFRIAYRIDNPKYSQEFAFDVQNITNHKNPLYKQYNKKTNELETIYQLTIFPMMQYKITF